MSKKKKPVSTGLATKDQVVGLKGEPITGITPRKGSTSGLVKMDKDPTKGAIKIKKVKTIKEFKPSVTYELVEDRERGEFVERGKVEFPDFKPVVDAEEVATAQGIDAKQITVFMQDFLKKRSEKGDPYAERNPADFSPPSIEIAGNDGIHVWLEVYKYGRQTTDRICKHMGAYTHEYTLSIITLLINAGYFFKYEDGSVDCIPDEARDKFYPSTKKDKPKEPPAPEIDIEELEKNPKIRVVKIVEVEPEKKNKFKSKASSEEEIPDAEVEA